MLLLDTPILAHFQDDIERFLRQECSVPSFLSSVTFTYAQGGQNQNSQSVMQGDLTDDAGFGGSANETTIQVMSTQSLTMAQRQSSSREIQIEVEGEDSSEEDVDDEEVYDDDGSEEEEGYEDEDGGPDDRSEEDEDDIVVLD